ncbi:MAG: SulP family inorganic anion transporter [Lachnospiraceae bacterium]|nr:SulP family inorganic anion transporter [Lachnospiraceae bacterium]
MGSIFKDFKKENLLTDVIVGIVIALVSIPISMGYAQVAGIPVVYGLYGSLLPIVVYALITSSPRYIFGVDAAPAALTGGILVTLGITYESEAAKNIVPVITLVTAFWLLLFFFLRFDRLIKYISAPVMGGFITGIGMTIILMQVPKLFGQGSGTGELAELLVHIYESAKEGFNVLSFVLGVSTVVIILIMKKIAPKVPMAAIMMIVGALITVIFHVEDYGVKLLPAVKPGLPKIMIPKMSLIMTDFREILLSSFTISIVIFSETLLATQNFGMKYEDTIQNRQEILAYSAGNFVAAFLGVCPVNGSVSRTGMACQYGIKSQFASLVAAVTMLFVLLFGTGFIEYLPVPMLTAIVISALIGTFEFDLAIKLYKVDKKECVIFMAAFLTVLIFGTIYGVLIGILLSSIAFIVRVAYPTTDFLGSIEGEPGFYSLFRHRATRPIKNVVLYRFSSPLFYANIGKFQSELENVRRPDTKVIIVDASSISSVDATACERLVYIYEKYQRMGIKFMLACHSGEVNDELRVYGAGKLIDENAVFMRIEKALKSVGIEPPYEFDKRILPVLSAIDPDTTEDDWKYGSKGRSGEE